MNAIGQAKGRSRVLRDARGYTLVEMMIGIGIAVVVGMGLYQVFNAMQRSSAGQRLRNDVQTGCTAAMDQMKSELALGGYRAVDTATPISNASAGSITFEYWDDNAEPVAGRNNNIRVTYRRATTAESGGGPQGIKPGDLIRESYRYATPSGPWDTTPTKQVLVDNVLSLGFTYMQSDNTMWDGISLGGIKTIRPTLICESSRPDPVSKKTLKITLTGEVRARNVGVSATPKDTIKPTTPTGVVAWDEGRCGELNLRWYGNTDTDLEGYVIYSGLASGAYTKRTRLTRPPKTAANSPEYSIITGLTSARSTDPAGSQPMYYIALQSFDKSGNLSDAFSTPVFGNPASSRRTEAAATAGSDTTIHPLLPPAPVLTATPTPGPTDNSITLSWSAPQVSGVTVAGLVGYRLYRGNSPGFTVDDTAGTGNRIANETQLTADKLSWVDDDSKPLPGGRLKGCTTYYYKICAVICDTTLIAAYGAAQYSEASAAPTDNSNPPAPTLTAAPGWQRIILNLTNPVRTGTSATLDFDYTQIFYSTAGPLTMDADGNVLDGGTAAKLIPDPILSDRGTFRQDGATGGTINFDDENLVVPAGGLASPTLTAGTYYFLAVAHDLCGNTSTIEAQAEAKADQCNDCDGVSAGQEKCLDAPYPPLNVHVDTSIDGNGCYGATTLAWDFPDSYITDHPDFKAFRILRRELTGASTTFENSVAPISVLSDGWTAKTFTDGGTQDGLVYAYRVEAYDCYYFEWVFSGASSAGNDPANNISSVKFPAPPFGSGAYVTMDLNGVALGTPLLDTALPVLTGKVSGPDGIFGNSDDSSNYFHNTATFGIRNTSNAAAPNRLALDGLTTSSVWDNISAYLQKVDVGDNATSPFTNSFNDGDATLTHGSTGSTVTFTTKPPLDPLDDQIPVQSTFMTSNRSVNRTSDMRSNWIDYTFAYTNSSTGAGGCTARTTFYTPLGPYIYGVSQDKPYFGTLGWAVHGEDLGNFIDAVTVPGSVDVTVYAEVLDGSAAGIAAGNVRLYTYVDTVRAYPDEPPLSLFTSTPMTKGLGNQWYGTIPAASDANVWYHIIAQDSHGNFDRDPEPWAGSYEYYQQAPNYCETIPSPPTIAGSVSGANVTISWTAPATNATPSGAAYTDAQGYKLYRNDGTGWVLHSFHSPPTKLIPGDDTSFVDSAVPNLAALKYDYYMTALDLCSPTPNESAPSNTYTENLESDCSNTPSPPVITLGTSTDADGGAVTLTWSKPTTNASPSIAPLTDLAGYQVWRQRDNLAWTVVPDYAGTTCGTITDPSILTCVDTGPRAVGIRNSVYKYYVTAFDSCATPNYSAGSNIYQESESNNPCLDTPNPPAILTGPGGSSSSPFGVILKWSAPTLNDDNATIYGDQGGYYIERSGDGGASWTQIGSTDSVRLTYPTDGSADLPANIGSVAYQYRVKAHDTCVSPGPNESLPSAVYYEDYIGPCGTYPNPPVILTGAGNSSFSKDGVTLKWSAPTQNTVPAGQSYTDPGGYRVYRRLTTAGTPDTVGPWVQIGGDLTVATYLGGGPFLYSDSSIADTTTAGSPPTYIYDIGDAAKKYSYYVATIDSCPATNTPPGPNESGASNIFEETYTDACASLTTPANPGNLSLTFQNANDDTGDLSWAAASPAPDGYRVYGCSQADSAGITQTCTPVKINSPVDPVTGTTYTHSLGAKVKDIEWFYGIKAVNMGSCVDSSRWKESSGYNANGILIDPYR
ncbi:MAG: hypothetical protein ACYC9Y_08445 [Candidatus Methylomirabilia bacterium]